MKTSNLVIQINERAGKTEVVFLKDEGAKTFIAKSVSFEWEDLPACSKYDGPSILVDKVHLSDYRPEKL